MKRIYNFLDKIFMILISSSKKIVCAKNFILFFNGNFLFIYINSFIMMKVCTLL